MYYGISVEPRKNANELAIKLDEWLYEHGEDISKVLFLLPNKLIVSSLLHI